MRATATIGCTRAARGFTIIETAITSALMVAVIGGVVGLMTAGQRSIDTGMTRTRLEGQARTAVGRLASELRAAKIDAFAGGAATVHTLTYRRRYGAYHENANQHFDDFDLSAANIRWDQLPQATLRLDLAPGEISNARDDNGNGIIDECVVSQGVGGATRAMCTNVASNGLTFRWASAKTLEISLTLVAQDANGDSFTVPVTELVFPRN